MRANNEAIEFGDDQHKYRLDRYSGELSIEFYNKIQFSTIRCSKRTKKF